MIKELPLFYYPTNIILVDDDVNYSKNLEMIMLDRKVPMGVFNDPKKALNFIKSKPFGKLANKLVKVEEEQEDKTIFNIDLSDLHQEIYNKDRFNDVSVIIVDYAMPGLNGKEFFEKIRDLPVAKILLTGEADYQMAVKMFNAGLIDRFFRKNDDDLFEKLIQAIEELKIQFFQKLSHSILAALGKKSTLLPFTNPAFIQFFLKTIQSDKMVEYYALDESGSFLLLQKNGACTGLIVKSEEDMQVLYELARDEKDIPKKVTEDLKNRKKLTYFATRKEHNMPAASWTLCEAHPLKANHETYYYSLVKNDPLFKLDTSQISNYQQFLKEHDL